MSEEKHSLSPSSSESSPKLTFSPTSTSFVYPVRSLLAAIQPAAPIPRTKSTDHVSSLLSQTIDDNTPLQGQGIEGGSHDLRPGGRESKAADEPTNFVFPDQSFTPDRLSDTPGSPRIRKVSLRIPRFPSQPSLQNILSSSASTRVSPASHSSSDVSVSKSGSKNKKRKHKKKSSPNYRHFPAEETDSNVPRTFSTLSTVDSIPSSISARPEGQSELLEYPVMPLPLVANPALAATSASLLPSATTQPALIPHYNTPVPLTEEEPQYILPQHPRSAEGHDDDHQPPGQASGDRVHSPAPSAEKWHTPDSTFSFHFEEPTNVPDAPPSEVADELTDLPFNPSQYGLVHLPPLPSPGSSERWSGSGSSSKQGSLYSLFNRSSKRRGPGSVLSDNFQSIGGSSEDSKYFSSSPEPVPRSSPEGDSTGSPKAVSSREGATSTSDSGQSTSGSGQVNSSIPTSVGDESSEVGSRGSMRTESRSEGGSSSTGSDGSFDFRFQYAEDDNGHHVIIGREGKLRRCEDEPIRTPGAVQGFGVMMALEDLEDTLVVRQVSENSTELLGLSPHYLFSLECFTDTLPDGSAGVLWDNIQFLTDPACTGSDEEDSAPHIFTLSGWGEPGPDPPGTDEGGSSPPDTKQKRSWTCWCAVHRAQPISDSKPGLIVLEFELESDPFNPLYPPRLSSFKPNLPDNLAQSLLTPDSIPATPPGESSSGSTAVSGGSDSSVPLTTLSTDSETLYTTPSPSPSEPPSHPPDTKLPYVPQPPAGLEGQDDWIPSAEDIIESTTSHSKPLPALERLRRLTQSTYGTLPVPAQNTIPSETPRTRTRRRGTQSASAAAGMMDVFAVMAQINDQLGAANDLDTLLKVTVGVIKDLTQFHRVMVYQFDEVWNGVVTAELVDWGVTRDLFRGLHFPAADIPKQARDLYAINKVRVLYDRSQPTARIVAKDREDLEEPLNMTHCHLRAMSPIHLQYLENMGVRASMSISIMAFGQLWGLISCHSYGSAGMRVSFPVRQMLRLLSQSISRNVERLSYAQRLYTRKLNNPFAPDTHPSGCIVTNPDDLLGLFDADFAILVIGEGAKLLGPNQHGQEILIMAEYLRLKQFETIQASQAVINDFPDLCLTTGLEVIAGLLYVPLSSGGQDFIAFLRRGQLRDIHWAGRPYKNSPQDIQATLEPRKSFKVWSETVAGRCRAWTNEQLETAGVLALVYGKFIEVWRQKQDALQSTTLTNLLLSNATHEVRTPLNHIINYLEMAMNGPLDGETRDNLVRSHAASKSLLFTINDLLDLTRLESGNETSFNEPFDLHATIEDAVHVYRQEASRCGLEFSLDVADSPATVVGDSRKIRTVVQNLTANALKYTKKGSISVSCNIYDEPEGLRSDKQAVVEIVVADTGCGIQEDKLAKMFREFEQVEISEPRSNAEAGVGLGLAVVARIVEQLGGQLRVDSNVDHGSKFSFLIPLTLFAENLDPTLSSMSSMHSSNQSQDASRESSSSPAQKEVNEFVQALSTNPISRHVSLRREAGQTKARSAHSPHPRTPSRGGLILRDTGTPIRPVKGDYFDQEVARANKVPQEHSKRGAEGDRDQRTLSSRSVPEPAKDKLRILIVEDNDLNRTILAKRLKMTGHTVVNATNGQEGIDVIKSDDNFDAILMDIQMPIVNGFEATQRIRALETDNASPVGTYSTDKLSHKLNGRIPIFAVSASLMEQQREELMGYGMDGWILKPIDFKRLNSILKGITDLKQRECDVYKLGGSWEVGGWFESRLEGGGSGPSDN